MQADKVKINRLLKTARGQIDGIIKMIEQDRYCIDVSNQIIAATAILKKTNKEIIHAHIESCVKEAFENKEQDNVNDKIDELLKVIDKL